MNTITLPATTSALINVLLRVVTGWEIPSDVAARAADLIALDLRFNDWFSTAGKTSASEDEIHEALELLEQRTQLIERLWSEYESTQGRSAEALRIAIDETCQSLRSIIEGKRQR